MRRGERRDQERKGLVCGTVIIDIRRREVEDERHHSFRVQLWKEEESIRKEGASVRRAAFYGYCCVWNARWWERLIIFLLCVPFAFESIWIRHFDQVCLLLLFFVAFAFLKDRQSKKESNSTVCAPLYFPSPLQWWIERAAFLILYPVTLSTCLLYFGNGTSVTFVVLFKKQKQKLKRNPFLDLVLVNSWTLLDSIEQLETKKRGGNRSTFQLNCIILVQLNRRQRGLHT